MIDLIPKKIFENYTKFSFFLNTFSAANVISKFITAADIILYYFIFKGTQITL